MTDAVTPQLVTESAAATAPFQISVTNTPAESVVVVAGDLDLANAPRLAEALACLCPDCPQVVVDVAGLTFCDSTGLSVFVAAHDRRQATGSRLVLARPTPELRRLLAITALDTHLHVRQ